VVAAGIDEQAPASGLRFVLGRPPAEQLVDARDDLESEGFAEFANREATRQFFREPLVAGEKLRPRSRFGRRELRRGARPLLVDMNPPMEQLQQFAVDRRPRIFVLVQPDGFVREVDHQVVIEADQDRVGIHDGQKSNRIGRSAIQQ
jgi:hypothetical protein